MGGEAKALLLSYGIIPIVGYCGSADDAADLLITGRLPIVDPGAGMGFGGGCSGSCGGCSGCGTSNGGLRLRRRQRKLRLRLSLSGIRNYTPAAILQRA